MSDETDRERAETDPGTETSATGEDDSGGAKATVTEGETEESAEPMSEPSGEQAAGEETTSEETVVEADAAETASDEESSADEADEMPTEMETKVKPDRDLAKKERRLDERELGLDKRAEDLDEREAQLDEREAELEEFREELLELRDELQDRETRLNRREENLDSREEDLDEFEEELSERATELAEHEETLNNYIQGQVEDLETNIRESIQSGLDSYEKKRVPGRFGTTGNLLVGLAGVVLVAAGVGYVAWVTFAATAGLFDTSMANYVLGAVLFVVGLATNLVTVTDSI